MQDTVSYWLMDDRGEGGRGEGGKGERNRIGYWADLTCFLFDGIIYV